MRAIGSSCVDPYSAMAGAAAALYGPLHGGANEEVLKMLSRIDDTRNIPEFIQRVKNGEGKLMGFGHRIYKNYDPRARIIKRVADEVFELTGRNRLLDIALELERIALEDEYFISRKLYPNVDFYSGIIYQAMGLPMTMFPVMFAIPRTVGWLAQWQEMITDPEQKIARPTPDLCRPLAPRIAQAEDLATVRRKPRITDATSNYHSAPFAVLPYSLPVAHSPFAAPQSVLRVASAVGRTWTQNFSFAPLQLPAIPALCGAL